MNISGQTILDLTFGAGGHTRRILDSSDDVQVLGLDRDPVAYSYGKELEKNYEERFKPLLGRFSEVPRIMEENGVSDGEFACAYLMLCHLLYVTGFKY